jgi:hypothetical protein
VRFVNLQIFCCPENTVFLCFEPQEALRDPLMKKGNVRIEVDHQIA